MIDAFLEKHMTPTERVHALLQEAMDSDIHGPRIRSILAEIDEYVRDKPVDYTGPDPTVRCAYGPCTNHLRRADIAWPQFCSKAHRDRGAYECCRANVPALSLTRPDGTTWECPECDRSWMWYTEEAEGSAWFPVEVGDLKDLRA